MAPFMEGTESLSDSSLSDRHTENTELDGNSSDAIAIIGLSFKFPDDGDTPEGFWDMMVEQRTAARDFPADRVNVNGHYRQENRHNSLTMRGGNFLKDPVAAFDADFFSISPSEANALDPMQQKLLEVSYHAFENAGIPIENVACSETSVYTGCFTHDYLVQTIKDPDDFPTYGAYGIGASMLANRISHFYNLMGPSIAVDSACSSSAMALDMAVQSLRTGSSSMSLVAGCNLTFGPETFAMLSTMNMLSKDNRSYSFDSRANGYARGEGIAVVIVKRLDDAIRDGNTIRAVIRATGANEDGRTPGITQPSQAAQQCLIEQTYKKAGLSKSLTRYCEAHGTGTPLGDPLESAAIGNCFRDYRSDDEPMYLGSVKSNIGHTEGASGLAGVIKAVFALEHGIIPPNADFRELNPRINAEYLRLKIPTEPTPWPTKGLRRISINSFGYGGANCHIVVDDAYNFLRLRGIDGKHKTAPCPPDSEITDTESYTELDSETTSPKLLVLSTSDEGGAERLASSYGPYLLKRVFDGTADAAFFNSLIYTLDSHRSQLPYRSSVVAESAEELMEIGSMLPTPRRTRPSPLQLGFVFTGQGAQWYAMGRELLAYPIYKNSIEEASAYLKYLGCSWSAMEELGRSREDTKIDDPEYSQTLCTVIQVAIVDLLDYINVKPVVVVGHSSGEIGAAYAGRYISKQTAWKVAYQRGILASMLTRSTEHGAGAMMAVGLAEEDVLPYIEEVLATEKADIGLRVACVNSPTNVTVAGDEHLIDVLNAHLNAQGTEIFARKLRVQVAYHSPQMQAVATEYLKSLGSQLKGPPTTETIPMISSVTGKPVKQGEVCQAEYWVANMVSPVLFSPAVTEMCGRDSAVDFLVEIGPHSALEGPLREILKSPNTKQDIGYTSILVRNKPATATLLHAAGNLWCETYPVNVRKVNELDTSQPTAPEMLIDLPSYAFDHSHTYWHESRLSRAYRLRDHFPHDFLGSRCLDWSPLHARWRLLIRVRELPWIADHVVDGRKVYPGTGMMVMAIQAAKELCDPLRTVSGFVLRDVDLSSAMELEGLTETLEVITSLRPRNGVARDASAFEFDIVSCTNPVSDEWVRNIRGTIEIEYEEESDWIEREKKDFARKIATNHQSSVKRCMVPVDDSFMYQRLKGWGLDYGPSFRRAKDQFVNDSNDEAVANILTLKGEEEDFQDHVVHPATLDAIGHLCFTAFSAGGKKSIATAMPSTIEYAWISNHGLSAPGADSIHTCSKIVKRTPRGFQAEVTGVNPDNADELRVYMRGCTMAFISEAPEESDQYKQVELPNPAQQWFNVLRKVDLAMLSWTEAEQYIREQCGDATSPLDIACKYIELAAHKKPGMQILQLGTGKMAEMKQILDSALDQGSGALTCAKYDIAESDEEKIADVKAAFGQYRSKMNFHDASSSEHKSRKYDLIILLQSGSTPKSLKTVLGEVKDSLEVGGILVARGPILEPALLEDELSKHGFSKQALSLTSQEGTGDGIIISALEEETDRTRADQNVRLVVAGDFTIGRHKNLIDELERDAEGNIQLDVVRTSLIEASQDPELKSSILILLSDPQHLCLQSMTPESFSALQSIMAADTKLLWVSDKGAEQEIGGSPVSTIIEGSGRSLCMENSNLHMVLLTLESFSRRSAKHVLPVLKQMLNHRAGSNYEQDHFEVDGRLHTDRLIHSSGLKETANAKLTPQYEETVKVGDHDFKLDISRFSQLDTLHFVEDTHVRDEQLIDVQVSAVAIESWDHKEAMGKGENQKSRFGHAFAGVIADAGATERFKVGDQVFAMREDSFRSKVQTSESHLLKLPDTISPARACENIPALTAAHYAITEVARWREGESALIFPCTGFIGHAAIQICLQLGIKTHYTVHSEEQSAELYERFKVPPGSVLPYQAFSSGRPPAFGGADIVVCLELPNSRQDWSFVNKFGRVVYLPSISGSPYSMPSLQLPANVSFGLLDFAQVAAERPHLLRDSFRCAIDTLLLTSEENMPTTFPASRVVDAFHHVADGGNQAVVLLSPEDEIVLTRKTRSTTHLDPNATYVISGGTGGIGRSMARWCAARGARHLILLSRSGAKSESAKALVSSLMAQGVDVAAPACDTADEETLRTVLQDCLLHMPPVKGCMQASGAYKDLTFDKYTLDGWNTAIRSKATSSWNLHKVLPSGMDFFVMLSSVSGLLGAISMSSYAGANSYQDGLARHRISIGEKATSLNPGVLHDIGFVTEFTDAQKDRLERMGFFIPTWEAEICAVLDIFCNPECSMINATQYRPIFGVNSMAQMAANGSEIPFIFTQPLWQHTMYSEVISKDTSSAKNQDNDVRVVIKNAGSLEEATLVATGALRKQLAVLLATQEERVQDGASVDSLVAIELRNWLGKTFQADIPVFEIVSASTWSSIGESIAAQVREAE